MAGSAVFDVAVNGEARPVIVKDQHHHPIRDHIVHIDLLEVRLDEKIQTTVALEITGVEESPGVKEGGVLEHVTRELNVEALPTAIPESIAHDVGEMQIGDTIPLEAVAMPEGVTLLDDASETIIATLSPPRLQVEEEEEVEAETELVGEEAEAAEAGEGGEEPSAEAGSGEE